MRKLFIITSILIGCLNAEAQFIFAKKIPYPSNFLNSQYGFISQVTYDSCLKITPYTVPTISAGSNTSIGGSYPSWTVGSTYVAPSTQSITIAGDGSTPVMTNGT